MADNPTACCEDQSCCGTDCLCFYPGGSLYDGDCCRQADESICCGPKCKCLEGCCGSEDSACCGYDCSCRRSGEGENCCEDGQCCGLECLCWVTGAKLFGNECCRTHEGGLCCGEKCEGECGLPTPKPTPKPTPTPTPPPTQPCFAGQCTWPTPPQEVPCCDSCCGTDCACFQESCCWFKGIGLCCDETCSCLHDPDALQTPSACCEDASCCGQGCPCWQIGESSHDDDCCREGNGKLCCEAFDGECKCRGKKIVIPRNSTWKERKSTAQVKKAVKMKVAKNKKKNKKKKNKNKKTKIEEWKDDPFQDIYGDGGTPEKYGYEELGF